MRHTFAIHAIEKVSPGVVGSVLGHASMATTNLYGDAALRSKARGIRAFAGEAVVDGAPVVLDVPRLLP
jgi:integrase